MADATTYPELLRTAVAQHPDQVFAYCASASDDAGAVTFGDLEDRSRRVAAGLLTRGIHAGDRIAIAALNQAEWLEVFFGAARIGVVVVMLNIRYREGELRHMLNQSGARLVVSAATAGDFDFESFYAGFRDQIPAVDDVLFLTENSHGRPYADLLADPAAVDLSHAEQTPTARDPAAILYTSGTTGNPKGAVLTPGSLLGAGRAQVQHLGTNEQDVYLCVLPLNHVGGITCNITDSRNLFSSK
jgi:fatty-acyl-CoA synthase